MDAKIGLPDKIIPAKIIITQIENSEAVDYDGITISGNLDLRELKLPLDDDGRYIIKVPIKITHSEISGLTKILNVNFSERIDFSGTTFINADFQGSVFSKFV